MDPLRHPDLIKISRRLRNQLAEVLEAEQEAAAVTLRRRSTIRDRLLDAEDRAESVRVSSTDGKTRTGTIVAVGIDHVVLETDRLAICVALAHIVVIQSTGQ